MRDVIEKIAAGEALSDTELDAVLTFYTELTDSLELLGPVFSLAANETRHIRDRLRSSASFRRGEFLCEGSVKVSGPHPFWDGDSWVTNPKALTPSS